MRLDRPDLKGEIYYHLASEMALKQLIYVHSTGEFYAAEGYRVQRGGVTGGPFHPTCQLIYTLDGNGYVEYRGICKMVQQGDIAIMNCREPNAYGTCAFSNWHKLWVHFDGINSVDLVDTIICRYGHVIPTKRNSVIPKHMRQIVSAFKELEPISEPFIASCIYSMLMVILADSSEEAPYGDGCVSTVLRAVSFIEANLDGCISVEHLARTAGLSISHFSRLFRSEMGCSPRKYILDTKIEHAKKLLKTTDLTIKEIGVNLGFKYESHFVSAFKGRVGLSPKQFQQGSPADT